jgi:hypothetical protein
LDPVDPNAGFLYSMCLGYLPGLEDELHCRLEDTRISPAEAVVAADSGRDLAEVRGIKGINCRDLRGDGARHGKIRMIQNVERFRAELERHLLAKHEGSRKGQVNLHFTGPFYVVVPEIAVVARGGVGKWRTGHKAPTGILD